MTDRPSAGGPERRGDLRTLSWGAVAAGVYLVVLAASVGGGLLPALPLYDGSAPPPPYRYVDPPQNLAQGNQPALDGTATVKFTKGKSDAASAGTQDGQAFITFPQAAVAPSGKEKSFRVTIEPLAPSDLAPAPTGRLLDGNAYRFEAEYATSGDPVELEADVNVVLRYPVHADRVARLDEEAGEWVEVSTIPAPAGMQVFADTDEMGTFVATAPINQASPRPDEPRGGSTGWMIGLGAGALVVMAATAFLVIRRGRARTGPRPPKPKAKAKAKAEPKSKPTPKQGEAKPKKKAKEPSSGGKKKGKPGADGKPSKGRR